MTKSDIEHILVTEYFHPDTASTGQLMTDLAVGLQERGLDMTVLTSQPNYHSGKNEKQSRVTDHKGVTVNRIRAPQIKQTSLLRRLFNWIIFTIWVGFVLLISRPEVKRELVFVSNPPFLPPVLWFICKIRGWEYTHIVHDLYPDFLVETGYVSELNPLVMIWQGLYRQVLRDAKYVVALGPVMRERLISTADDTIDQEKVVIIHNWEDKNFIKPREKGENWFSKKHGLTNKFTLLYSGNIGKNHDLETVIKSATNINKSDDIQYFIIGNGDKKDSIISLSEELDVRDSCVTFLPYQPFEDLPYSLTAGDISIVTVQKGMEGICVSSKLYTALAAGSPILLISQENDDEAQIVQDFNAGIQVEQGDVRGVAEAIRQWTENPELVREQGKNAREAFERTFTKSQSIDRYYNLLSEGPPPKPQQIH